jgi:hypothetical protein
MPEHRRAAFARKLEGSERLQALLAEQQRALAQLQARDERAPQALRAAVERRVAAADMEPVRPRTQRTRLAWAWGLAALAVAAVLAITLPGGEPGAPSLAQAAALAQRDATGPPIARMDDLRYPDWRREYGWKPSGARVDQMQGRRATTVFYQRRGWRIGYTIVARPPLGRTRDARRVIRRGSVVYRLRLGGRPVVTWVRAGHTCVLSGDRVPSRTLALLASAE